MVHFNAVCTALLQKQQLLIRHAPKITGTQIARDDCAKHGDRHAFVGPQQLDTQFTCSLQAHIVDNSSLLWSLCSKRQRGSRVVHDGGGLVRSWPLGCPATSLLTLLSLPPLALHIPLNSLEQKSTQATLH